MTREVPNAVSRHFGYKKLERVLAFRHGALCGRKGSRKVPEKIRDTDQFIKVLKFK